ncbi:MAG TPA: hypothetical protein VN661_10610 [Candidatus Acidoferrales bacterium]|nr:hypothetical protein [Candidatus Acidoferrales bacterium]
MIAKIRVPVMLIACLLLGLSVAKGRPAVPAARDGISTGRTTAQVKAGPEKQWQLIGQDFVRSLSSIERANYSQHGKYEATMTLYSTRAMSGTMQGLARKFGISALRNWGWDFFVDLSPNGKEYQASVHATRMPVTPSGAQALHCLPVFFADQTGAVYEGKQLGCP